MKFFLDTANIAEIKEAKKWGLVDGATTNPSLISKENKPFKELVVEILNMIEGPVSIEVTKTTLKEMIEEAKEYSSWKDNVVIKVPITKSGVEVVNKLKQLNIKTNVTLVFNLEQALIAAKINSDYVSPFIGRLDDLGYDGMELVKDIINLYREYKFATEVIVASIRHPLHVVRAAKLGAHIATMPFKVMEQLFVHPLTIIGLEQFLKDWQKLQKNLSSL